MSSIRSFASPQMAALSHDVQRRSAGQALALVLALLAAVLIVEAVAITSAVHTISESGWLYASTT
jgi:hypothetical protein